MASATDSLKLLTEALKNTLYENDVYLVGGAVRDRLLNLPIKDVDLVVSDHGLTGGIDCAEFLAKKLNIFKKDSNPVIFPRFGTAKLTLSDGMDIEFVAPRKEQYTEGSRKPLVTAGTLEDDAFRRDFTINALFQRLSDYQILDLTGKGLQDLFNKVINTTSDASYIFNEDPLRMLRAVRFACKYNFDLPLYLIRALKTNAAKLKTISQERIQDELNKILLLPKPSKAIRLFHVTGLLQFFLPELETLVGVTQNSYHKDDVFMHTMNVLDNAVPELMVRLSALFHDCGKPLTRTEVDGKVRFIGHDEVGAEIAKKALHRLKYSNEVIDYITTIVKHHMDLKFAGNDLKPLKDKHLRKLIFKMTDKFHSLLKLMDADNNSHAEHANMPDQINSVLAKICDWDLSAIINTRSILDGNEIHELGAEGKLIGEIKERILEKVLEKPSFKREVAIELAKNMIESRKKKNA